MVLKPLFFIGVFEEGGPGDPKTARGSPPSSFSFPWSSWPSFWPFPGSLPSGIPKTNQKIGTSKNQKAGQLIVPEGGGEPSEYNKASKGLLKPL